MAARKPPRAARARYARADMTAMLDQIERSARETLEEAGKEAEKFMKDRIDKSVTPYGTRRFAAGRGKSAGRRDTDRMYQAVSYRVEEGPVKTYLSFGWIKDFTDYFSYQETGTSRGLTGMFALRDAREHVKDVLPKIMEKNASKATRRFNSGGRK